RDLIVTGVQTCALPISRAVEDGTGVRGLASRRNDEKCAGMSSSSFSISRNWAERRAPRTATGIPVQAAVHLLERQRQGDLRKDQIGRASCRGSVKNEGM